jgi:hypothetical protein
MTAAGGFRLALWSEDRPHHGPRLDRALARYDRYAEIRKPGFPAGDIAAFAYFLTHHCPRQNDGPEHGMAYDVARFDELTKQMSAAHHYHRPEHLEHAAKRARRRHAALAIAETINARLLPFRLDQHPTARLRTARELLDSPHHAHQHAGRALYADAQREQRLQERDARLLAGRHPGPADGRYTAACAYDDRWNIP